MCLCGFINSRSFIAVHSAGTGNMDGGTVIEDKNKQMSGLEKEAQNGQVSKAVPTQTVHGEMQTQALLSSASAVFSDI